jgi:hypothetical protein
MLSAELFTLLATYYLELYLKLCFMRAKQRELQAAAAAGSSGPAGGGGRMAVRLPSNDELLGVLKAHLVNGLAFVGFYTHGMLSLGPWLTPEACAVA